LNSAAAAFLSLRGLQRTHVPLVEDAQWTGPYETKIADPSRRLFAASVTHMDAAIGSLSLRWSAPAGATTR